MNEVAIPDEHGGVHASHIMTPGAFTAILAACEPGKSFVYYVGHLAYDCGTAHGIVQRSLAKTAWRAYRNNKGTLAQQRVSPHEGPGKPPVWNYLFVKKAEQKGKFV